MGAGRDQRGTGSEAEQDERRKGIGWGTNETARGVAAAPGYRCRARALWLWRGKKGGLAVGRLVT